jgi:hypothetical protein
MSNKPKSPSRMVDERIKELGDRRGKLLSRIRTLIKQADPVPSTSARVTKFTRKR